MAVRVQEAASLRLDEIYRYTRDRWGAEQADRYITDLFAAFGKIEVHGVASRPIPAEFAITGFYFRHEHHFVYWRRRMRRLRPIEFRLAGCGDVMKRRAVGSSSGTTRRGPYAPSACWA